MTITELLPKLAEEERKYLEHHAKSEKEAYDYLASKGLTDSFEEFTDFAKKMEKLSDTELGDDELEKIAGGFIATSEEQLQAMYDEYLANWTPKGPGNGNGRCDNLWPMDYGTWKSETESFVLTINL